MDDLLEDLAGGRITLENAKEEMWRRLYVQGVSNLDFGREGRTGIPEVIIAEGKSAEHLRETASSALERGDRALISRIDEEIKDNLLGSLEGEFKDHVANRLIEKLRLGDEKSVVAVIGTASLYGFIKISELVRSVEQSVRGRLVIFFPGTKDENNYRLLDARDGWNYLANGITLHKRGHML